jgi:nucleotide-binding universal stress UspA family protein
MLKTIAVGTDGSDTAAKAVDFALEMAEKFGATLVVTSSYRPKSEAELRKERADAPADIQWMFNPQSDVEAILREVEEQARDRGVETVSDAREGSPADVIVDVAADNDADVLVIGNKGMQRKVLGSVPNSVSHNAPCSVIIVKTT